MIFVHVLLVRSIGPRQVLTRQSQGYRLERRQNRPESTLSPPVDRLVLCQVCFVTCRYLTENVFLKVHNYIGSSVMFTVVEVGILFILGYCVR